MQHSQVTYMQKAVTTMLLVVSQMMKSQAYKTGSLKGKMDFMGTH